MQAFVAGEDNSATGDYSTVGGGRLNTAGEICATVGGGCQNTALSVATVGGGSGNYAYSSSTIAGGFADTAYAVGATIGGDEWNIIWIPGCIPCESYATISGGMRNRITGWGSFIGAGYANEIHGDTSVIGGGAHNIVTSNGNSAVVTGGSLNTANEEGSAILGGKQNSANGINSVLCGGNFNSTNNSYSCILGGYFNDAAGQFSTILGGQENYAPGSYSCIAYGTQCRATGDYSFAGGNRAWSSHSGSVVWADNSTATTFGSSGMNQFLIRAAGGVGIGTNSPEGLLHVRRGNAGSVTADPFAIAVFEDTNNAYLNMLTPDASESGILFGSPVLPEAGGIIYNGTGASDGLLFRTNGNANRMVIDASGKVGIGIYGTSVTNALTLPNNADATGQAKANSWLTYSSRRWKTDIQTLDHALGRIQKLRGVTYRPKEGGAQQIGLIAEEVGEVVPQVVQYEENGVDAQSIDYARLVALLIEGMKEQQRQIDELKARLDRQTP